MQCQWVGNRSNSTAYFYAMSNSFKYFTTVRNFSSFFLAFSCTYIVCGVNSYSAACMHFGTVTPTSYMYKSNDKYWCWTIYSRTTFSSLPLPFFILIIFYSQYASVYGYADFLHVQIMDCEIYTINILLKNKKNVKFSLHTTAKFLLKRMKVLA